MGSGESKKARLVRRIDSGSCRVELYVRGFSDQQLVAPSAIADAIQWLPGFHLEGLREVVYEPEPPLSYPSLGGGRPFSEWAVYAERESAIFIYRLHESLFWHVLYHEIGHHVYFRVLGSAAKKKWALSVHPGSPYPTSYSGHSPAEDFAECYALYSQHTRMLAEFPERLSFMRDAVFCAYKPGKTKQQRLVASSKEDRV